MTKADFISQLVAERDRLDWSDYRLAHECDLTATTVTRVMDAETGNPSIDVLLKIVSGLGKKLSLLPMNSREKQLFEKNRGKDRYKH